MDIKQSKRAAAAAVMDASFSRCQLPFLSRPSEVNRLLAGMKVAIKSYERAAAAGLDDGPYMVADDISFSTYEKWCSGVETCWKVSFIQLQTDEKGFVIMYGDPSVVHEQTVRWFEYAIVEQVGLAGLSMRSLVRGLGSAQQKISSGKKEPDCSYTSESADSSVPRVCIEIAYKNEDLSKLIKEVAEWHVSGVLLSLGVKVLVKVSGKNRDKKVDLSLFWVEQRQFDRQPNVKDFSPGICTQQNEEQFIITFPFSYFTEDVDPSADFLVKINLLELQQYIIKELIREAKENHKVIYIDETGEYRVGEDAFCLACQGAFEEEKMIQCDHPSCEGAWYHCTCVGLRDDVLPSTWFCPTCLKKSDETSKWDKYT